MLARVMAMIILGYAAIGILICLAVAISTSFVSAMGEFFKSEVGIFSSAALCLLLGTAFLLAARVAKFQTFFKVLGVLSLLEAPLFLLVPLDFWARYIDFWLVDNLLLYRTIGIPIGIGMFAFVIVSALPGRNISNKQIK